MAFHFHRRGIVRIGPADEERVFAVAVEAGADDVLPVEAHPDHGVVRFTPCPPCETFFPSLFLPFGRALCWPPDGGRLFVVAVEAGADDVLPVEAHPDHDMVCIAPGFVLWAPLPVYATLTTRSMPVPSPPSPLEAVLGLGSKAHGLDTPHTLKRVVGRRPFLPP